MVGEFICCSFCGDAAALVEGFVEDADSFEGLAVCAGGCAGALGCVSWMWYDIDLCVDII